MPGELQAPPRWLLGTAAAIQRGLKQERRDRGQAEPGTGALATASVHDEAAGQAALERAWNGLLSCPQHISLASKSLPVLTPAGV